MQARRALLIFATNGIGALVGLVSLFAIGRLMSPAAYGSLGFALSFIGIWLVLADLGVDRTHARHIAGGHDLARCLGTYRAIKLALLGAVLVGIGISLSVWHLTPRFRDATGILVLVVVAVYTLLAMGRSVPTATLNALRYTATTQAMVVVEHLVRLPLVVVAALAFGMAAGLDLGPWVGRFAAWFPRPLTPFEGGALLAGAFLVSMLASLLVGLHLYRRHGLPRGHFDPVLLKSYLAMAVPLAIVVSTKVIFTHLDAILIGWFLVAENVGYYFAADRITFVAYAIPLAVQTVYFPLLTELAARGARAELNEVAHVVQRMMSITMVLIALFFIVYPAEGIYVLVGAPFLSSARVVRVLALYTLLLTLSTIPLNVAVAMGHARAVALIGLMAIAINAVIGVLLIPDTLFGRPMFGFHSVGAALSTLIAQVVALALLARLTLRLTGTTYLRWSYLRHLAAALLATPFLLVAGALLFPLGVRWWTLGAVGIVGTVVYLAALVLFKEVGRRDLHLAMEVVNPQKMLRYVREELRGTGRGGRGT